MAVGKVVYTDRTYTFTVIPSAYVGKTYIKTANADKYVTSPNYLTFTLGRDAAIFIALDNRTVTLPGWIDSSWNLTGDTISTSDVQRRIYRKSFSAGTVVLGGNGMPPVSGANSNYNVIVIEN